MTTGRSNFSDVAVRIAAGFVLIEAVWVFRLASQYNGTFGAGQMLEFVINVRASVEARWLLSMLPIAVMLGTLGTIAGGAGPKGPARIFVWTFVFGSAYVLAYEWVVLWQILSSRHLF